MEPPSIYSRYFRFLMYLAHSLTAIFFLTQAFVSNCNQVLSVSSYSAYSPNFSYAFPASKPTLTCPPPKRNVTVFGIPSVDWGYTWCEAMLIPQTWDVQQDERAFTIGASWNILMIITMFEWITASFALMYTEEPTFIWSAIPTPPGLVAQPFLATIWNLTLLILMWACRNMLRIPDNNLFLFTAILLAVIVKQNYMAKAPEPQTTTVKVMIADSSIPLIGAEWKTDTFIRNRRRKEEKELAPHFGAGAEISFHLPQYVQLLDSSGKAVIARLMEYTSTAPLLMVGTLINSDSTAPTWLYQVVLLSMVGCNSVSPVIHYALALYKVAEDKSKIMIAGGICFIASWLMFSSAFLAYIYDARQWIIVSPADSGIPDWVLGLIWIVILGYFSFGAIMTYLYIPFYFYGSVDNQQFLESSATLVWWFDLLSLTVKLAVAWTVYTKGSVVNCLAPTC